MSKNLPQLETDPRFPSGRWVGFFIQRHRPPGKHETELHLTFSGGVLTGEGRDWVGKFVVRGRYDPADGRCHWIKQYVGKHAVARRRIGLHEIIHNSGNGGLPVTAFHDLGSDRIGLEDALGRKQHPAAMSLIMNQPHAVGQSRLRIERDCRSFGHRCSSSSGTKAPGGMCPGAM